MSLFLSALFAASGFVPYDPAAEEQVSGARLMIAAYAVICGFLVLYALSLLLRARATKKRIRRLEARIPVERPADDAKTV